VALAEELLAVPSETGREAEITDVIEQRLAAWRPHVLIRAGLNLCVVSRPPDPAKRTVMLLGHTDTVPALDDNPVRREGDRLFGLGASDMKAAVAVIIDVLQRNRERPFRHNLAAVLYASEESAYDRSGMPEIHAAARRWFEASDLAVCMEPTDNQIELGCLGTLHALITFDGKRAHSARPWQGDNAIHEVNYRVPPGGTREEVERALAALVAGEGAIEIVDWCPAGRVCADNALVAELRAAMGDTQVRAKQAWTDVGRLSHLGLDAINWGPGTVAQAHQRGEWVSVAEIGRCLNALERWLG
jgi:succinyl-diaminopimelate desuccinylase